MCITQIYTHTVFVRDKSVTRKLILKLFYKYIKLIYDRSLIIYVTHISTLKALFSNE